MSNIEQTIFNLQASFTSLLSEVEELRQENTELKHVVQEFDMESWTKTDLYFPPVDKPYRYSEPSFDPTPLVNILVSKGLMIRDVKEVISVVVDLMNGEEA